MKINYKVTCKDENGNTTCFLSTKKELLQMAKKKQIADIESLKVFYKKLGIILEKSNE